MGRTKVAVSRKDLQSAIDKAEADGPLENRSKLAEAVAAIMGISPSVVILRIAEFKIIPKTPVGKKGRQPGTPIPKSDKPRTRKSRTIDDSCEQALKKHFPERFHGGIEKLKKGSLTAAVKLNCISCVGFGENDLRLSEEIRTCDLKHCPLWTWRPYQKSKKRETPDEQEDD